MATIFLNWLIEDMGGCVFLLRLVYFAVESMVEFQLQQNGTIVMIFSLCIVGFSLYRVFYRGEANNMGLTALDIGGSSLSIGIGASTKFNDIYFP